MALFLKKISSNFIFIRMCSNKSKSTGIIIIGDEILKGQVKDTNSFFILKELYNIGIPVKKISVIPDDINDISNEIRKFSNLYSYVITTGGIGSTHDDLTYQGVAKAFDEPLYFHPELVKVCEEFYKTSDLNNPGMRLAYVPKSSKLIYGFDKKGNKSKFPNVSVKNVYIFPGIPKILEYLFPLVLKPIFADDIGKFYKRCIFLNTPEVLIASKLSEIAKTYQNANIGSYPEFRNSYYTVKISVDSTSEELTNQIHDILIETFSNNIVNYDESPLEDSFNKMINFLNNLNNQNYKKTLDFLNDFVSKEKRIFLLFNGEIYSTVIIHILYSLLQDQKSKIEVIYYFHPKLNNIHKNFILQTANRYDFNYTNLYSLEESSNIINNKKILTNLNQIRCNNCELINPITNWTESEIWYFVRGLNLPYCELYDRGFTNINPDFDLSKNEKLKVINEDGTNFYIPTYKLYF